METVASHINEMQKIYEDYGSVFEQLAAEQSGADRRVTDVSMGEFLVHSSVLWLNPLPRLGRPRKEPELTLFGESSSDSVQTLGWVGAELGSVFCVLSV